MSNFNALLGRFTVAHQFTAARCQAGRDVLALLQSDSCFIERIFAKTDEHDGDVLAAKYRTSANNFIRNQGMSADVKVSKAGNVVFIVDLSKLSPEQRAQLGLN